MSGERVLLADAHEHDRQIARDAVRPERLLAERVLRAHVGARAQRTVDVEHARREPLVHDGVVARNVEVLEEAAPVRGGQRERPSRRARLAVLVRQGERGLAIGRDAGGERQAREPARREPNALAQAERSGSSVAPTVFESDRPSSACGSSGPRPRPRKRARSVSHSSAPCGRPSRLSTCTAHTSSASYPPGRRRQSSAPQSGRYSVSMNSLPKAGCAEIRGRRGERDLGVARDLDLAQPVAVVRDATRAAPRRRPRSRRRCRAWSRGRRRRGGR